MANRPLGLSWTLLSPSRVHPEPACREAGVSELWWLWEYMADDALSHIGTGVIVGLPREI